jgi:3',5'-cyclic AMP phosphodiesterase CpdA
VVALAASLAVLVLPAEASAARPSSREILRALVVARPHGTDAGTLRTPRWTDLDEDRCSTPDEVLLRDAVRLPRQVSGCRLLGGAWRDSLAGPLIRGSAGAVVSTLVPVREAWRSGAWTWSRKKLRVFANDLGYAPALLVTSSAALQDRADRDPGSWVPTRAPLRCRYLSRWVAVKQRWGLTVDPAERAALRAGLAGCGWPAVAPAAAPPLPSVRTLAASAPSATSVVVGCSVTTAEAAGVVVRFGPAGGALWRQSTVLTVAAGRSQPRITLRGLLPATTYAYRCVVRTPTAGRWPSQGTASATTLAVPAGTGVVGPSSTPAPSVPPPSSPPPSVPPPTVPPPSVPPPTVPPPSSGTRVVAVGDMCEPDPATCSATGDVAAWLDAPMYALLGDEQYENGTAAEYQAGYARSSWDDLKQRSLPALGNHEVQQDKTAAGYCGYFFGSAPCPRWYAYDIDPSWRAIVLDSNQPSSAAQLAWLDDELAADGARNLLVYWHHPRWRNSGSGHSEPAVGVLMQRLYAAHADIVLWGHDHMYTRWAKVGPDGPASDGFRAFTVGTGGAAKVGSYLSKPGTEKNLLVSGVLELTLRAQDYSWRLVDTSRSVRDSGSDVVTP